MWYTWTSPTSGNFRIYTGRSDIETVLYVFTGNSLATLTSVASGSSEADFAATAGVTYQIALHGYFESAYYDEPEQGGFEMDLSEIIHPVNDDFVNRVAITSPLPTAVFGMNTDATLES